ncbi:acyltransferase [uncultured Desulfobacter sp.]|uniref:acyltransferase family protein n=1 Tax=uncultured Desulfobacter sp. TaxID=240139 RepID=UPI0029C64723|nr:acyltransferase [uncultured Desulfobacter sp.]
MEGKIGDSWQRSVKANTYNFYLLSKYRSHLFGLAILCIMLFHSPLQWQFSDHYVRYVKLYLDFGVDLFLFLSGIGLYYSISKDKNIVKFYKRRLLRILPAYIPVACLWFFYWDFSWPYENFSKLLSNCIIFFNDIMLISFWTKGNLTEWFVAIIVIFYLIYPFIYRLLIRLRTRGIIFLIAICIGIVGFLLYFIDFHKLPDKYNWMCIALPRIPILLIGCWIAPKVKKCNEINNRLVTICAIIAIVFIIFFLINPPILSTNIFFKRLLYGPFAFCIAIWFSNTAEIVNNRLILKCFGWIGLFTFEIYLLHEKIIWLLSGFHLESDILINVSAISITLITVPFYKCFYNWLMSLCFWLCDLCFTRAFFLRQL